MLQTLLNRLAVAISEQQTPNLMLDGRIDQQDARILYYAYRFGALRRAVLGGLVPNPDAAMTRANALIQ